MTDTALRILALCMALASAETLHGIARAKVLREFDPRSGNYLVLGLSGLVLWPWVVMRLA